MTTYAVTRQSDQVEVYRYSNDIPVEWIGMEFATHDHTEVVEVIPVVNAPAGRTMTRLEFLRRFTGGERVTLRTVAKTNAGLEDYMALLDAAQDVDTSDPDTIAGVQFLEATGLLASGRATEILATSLPTLTPGVFGGGPFPITHHVIGLAADPTNAGVSTDGVIRMAGGRWTTVAALPALGLTLEPV